uniref:ARID DNA-binding domain-containing protein n=1 Tax=Tanacetum cinerariifolium TaxID=118510 RepID=A0A6L2KZH0_TANCI|nr:ARID DNA-binding domain-containing protein [Tanacetum cinerariifolium]
MIKGTDHGTWDDICSNHGGQGYLVPGVYYAPEVTLNIFSMDLLEKQGFEVIYEHNRCSLVYMFNKSKKEKLDEDILRTKQNQYLEEYFESLANKDDLGGYLSVHIGQEFGTIGEILGLLPKGNGENLKRCYIQYLDVFTSYYKTARSPQQEYKSILKIPTRTIEEGKDRDCLMSHQWNFGETCAPTTGQKVKGRLEHFGIKLEHTKDGKDDQPGHIN